MVLFPCIQAKGPSCSGHTDAQLPQDGFHVAIARLAEVRKQSRCVCLLWLESVRVFRAESSTGGRASCLSSGPRQVFGVDRGS